MMDILLVDGYNMIGAWPELKKLKEIDFEAARDKLIDMMAEYQASTGYQVIIVFDAHLVPGIQQLSNRFGVQVIFTNENETADEKIEQLVVVLKDALTRIYVATSDYAEQKAIFGSGAFRKSARELLEEVNSIDRNIHQKMNETSNKQGKAKIRLSRELKETFEKWRRGMRE